MQTSSVGSSGNAWSNILLPAAVGVIGSAFIVYGPSFLPTIDWKLQQKKVRIVFSNAMYFISRGFLGKHSPPATDRKTAFNTMPYVFTEAQLGNKRISSVVDGVKELRLDYFQRKIKQNKPLVGPKEPYQLVDGEYVLRRRIEPNGDCFFLSAAVGLLEYLQVNKSHLSFIIDAINEDSYLVKEESQGYIERKTVFTTSKNTPEIPISSKAGEIEENILNNVPFVRNSTDVESPIKFLTKESIISDLTQITFLQNAEDLEIYFADSKFMNKMVFVLRILMVSLLEQEPDFEMPDGPIPAVLSKENLYAEVIGALDPDSSFREEYPEDETFNPDAFKKILGHLRNSQNAWPSDSCIRALCCKLGVGFTILEENRRGVMERTCVETLPSGGYLLLNGEHYSKIYPFN